MAKNISLLGADYPAVPAVQLPQTGGGTATFYDIAVIDNLSSTSTTDALSANQGKTLNEKIPETSGAKTTTSTSFTANTWTRIDATGFNIIIPANSFYWIRATGIYNSSQVTGIGISKFGGSYSPSAESTTSDSVEEKGFTNDQINRYIFSKHAAAGNNNTICEYFYCKIPNQS